MGTEDWMERLAEWLHEKQRRDYEEAREWASKSDGKLTAEDILRVYGRAISGPTPPSGPKAFIVLIVEVRRELLRLVSTVILRRAA